MEQSKRKVIGIILISVIVISVTVSFAYFTSVLNNDKPETAILKTGTMTLTFDDNDNGINRKLMFGESVVKKFKIINTGNVEASLSLDFDQMINTYLNGSLSYNLTRVEKTEDESTTEWEVKEKIIKETNMPVSSKPIRQAIAPELSVPGGATYYYNLTITLNNTDFDQTDDKDAVYNTRFSVGEPTRYRYYRLTVDPNGGTWDEFIAPQEYLLMNKETMTITENPTRTGYTFAGWKLVGVSSKYENDTFTMGITDTYLIAEWTPNPHTVTIELNGGVSETGTSLTINYNETKDIPAPTREGYTFLGWDKSIEELILEGKEGTTDQRLTLNVDEDVTLTAKWEKREYKYIVYHKKQNINDDNYALVDASTDTEDAKAEYGSTIPAREYTGFTFKTGQTLLQIKHEEIEEGEEPVLNKAEYQYDREKHTLTLELDGGTYSEPATQELKYGETITLGSPTKTGYNFTNWTQGSEILSNNQFTMGLSEATLTANWIAKEYSVTFNANGGTTPTGSKTVTYNSEYGDLPIPTYKNNFFTFVGWFTEQTDGDQVVSSTTFTEIEDVTLYAHWLQKTSALVPDSLAENLINKANAESITVYNNGNKAQMYTFSHEATEQTSALTDYRYIGNNPYNWIRFNDEMWRIIGVFSVDDGNGNIEQRVKIMRASTIGKLAWNSVNKNNWENASLKTLLNGAYYSQTGDYTSESEVKGLSPTARGQIAESMWYLGAGRWEDNKTGEDAFALERGSTVAGASGSKLNISANVGLIYPSDYIYTFANKVNEGCFTNSRLCLAGGAIASWMYTEIMNKDYFWTIMPGTASLSDGFSVVELGIVYNNGANVANPFGVSPVVYLKSDIQITGGDGSEGNPYVLPGNKLNTALLAKANSAEATEYNKAYTKEMYTFSHLETGQTGALTDYRYIGDIPNNYITFNNEPWRIIGVFSVDDGNGNIEQRVKIMRNSTIGKIAWNIGNTNNWEWGGLKKLLNGAYYSQTGDYTSESEVKGLSLTARGQIAESTWYLGAGNWEDNKTGEDAYAFERGSTVAPADGSKQKTKANVGLIYPSDYIYTFANKVDDYCFKHSYNCSNGTPGASWMYNGPINKAHFWTIAPSAAGSDTAFFVSSGGNARNTGFVSVTFGITPVVYLKSDIQIKGGEGTEGEPYTISIPSS